MTAERRKDSTSVQSAGASSQQSTKTLVDKGQAGDASAFERLFSRLLPRIRRWAHGRLPGGARGLGDTSDLVQEAALGAWRRLDRVTLRERGDLEAYVRQAVQNRIRDEARRLDRRSPGTSLDSNVPDNQPSPFEQAVGFELSDRYRTAFLQLTEEERELVVARLEYGYEYQEVATLLKKPSAAAARMATVRALNRLKILMTGTTR